MTCIITRLIGGFRNELIGFFHNRTSTLGSIFIPETLGQGGAVLFTEFSFWERAPLVVIGKGHALWLSGAVGTRSWLGEILLVAAVHSIVETRK
jgi:hypothetical protein